MAEKPRTPKPPRPVQAPKVRSSSHGPRGGGSRNRLWIAGGAALLLIVAIGGGIALATSRGGGGGGGLTSAANDICSIQTFEGQGQRHVEKLPKGFAYNSFPPTSGPHFPEPLVFGEYSQPLEQMRLVHNLEHGGVGVQYGPDVPEETLTELTAWYRTDPRGLVVAPLPDDPKAAPYKDKIVLTAWVADREDPTDPASEITKQTGVRAVCSTFDAGTFDSFMKDNRAHGPELFSLDQLAPGF